MTKRVNTFRRIVSTLTLTSFLVSAHAQEVSIPDPGLNAAIRQTLQKPSAPLTESDLLSLTNLLAGHRNISSVEGLEAARNLRILDLDGNSLTNFPIADALTNLTILDLFGNHLVSFVLSNAPPRLRILDIALNALTQCSLPAGMTNLDTLFLENNALTDFNLPAGLTKLTQLDLSANQLTDLTLRPDMTSLTALFVAGNPLTTLVLSEPLAATSLAATVTALRNQGVQVFTYPVSIRLTFPQQQPIGAFRFGITGPPGAYTVLSSPDLSAWSALAVTTNPLGSVLFADTTAHLSSRKFYRALLQTPPPNMVFIPPDTFTMGSPTNEPGRNTFEGPQATVTLTRGFWIGKYEVTQGEYLAVTGENPSDFPGDLRRPISSVSWFDATNYCWKLTQQELAAERIPPGSHYRLPTEAEWECAARAGTTTRFSYGDDDPNYTSLTNYAWFLDLGRIDLIVHPVGQKLPNPWGLYDMHGHVWEWCQDWYDDQPGGILTDPTGPPGPVQFGRKVMRGGAYDYPNSDCRSASRFFRPATDPDSDLGFRVVLVMQSQ